MKRVIDTFIKILITTISLMLSIELIDSFADNYRWGYGPEILLELVVIMLILYPMVKAIDKAIKLSTNNTVENKTELWKILIVVQSINNIISFFDIMFSNNISIMTLINFLLLLYCVIQYKISLNKLKIHMIRQIIDLQTKLIK